MASNHSWPGNLTAAWNMTPHGAEETGEEGEPRRHDAWTAAATARRRDRKA